MCDVCCCSGVWEKATETIGAQPQGIVNGLQEGQEYQFRIIAVNKAGPGEPGKASKNFIAKPRYCKHPYLSVLLLVSK